MAKIRRRARAMEHEPNQNRKIENMKSLMLQLACSDPSKLPYKDLIEEKIQMLMMRSLPDHPTYAAMINGALQQLKEEKGSTEEAISSFIVERYDDLPLAHAIFLEHHLMQLVEKEEIVHTSGNRYMLIGSIARTEIKKSQDPNSKQQVEQIEGEKQAFNAKGSAEVNKEIQGEEQTIQAIDDRTEGQPGSTEQCNKELRENTDMIKGHTYAGKRVADESTTDQHNNGVISQQSQGLENPTEVIIMGRTDGGKSMADESTNGKGQHNNRVIRQQSRGLENPTEAIAARQEQLRQTYEAGKMLPLGEEQIQASDEHNHPEQQVDDIGYRNQLQDLKRLQEQQNDFYDKIIELYTIVENLKKSKKVDDPRMISPSSALTGLGVNQSCSLLFSNEEGLQLLWKVSGINHKLAEILNSSSLMEASKLASESVVGGQQRDLSANHWLPKTAPCQGPKFNHICSSKPQDECNQKRSYCRRASTKFGMKTMTRDIDADSAQLQEKSPSQVSHSKRHPDLEDTLVKSFKRKKKTKFSADLLEETTVGRSDQVKLVDQLGAAALVPSTTGRPHTEEHLKDTETAEGVKTRMQKKRSGEAKEPASTIVSEQLHQRQGKSQLSVPYSWGKRGPDSAVEDSSCLEEFVTLVKQAKKGTKMKLKQLDREQQEKLASAEVQGDEQLENTESNQKSQPRKGKQSAQHLDQKLNDIASKQLSHHLQQGQGLGQLRLTDPDGVTSPELIEIDTTQFAGVSSPEIPVEQSFQLRINTMSQKDILEPGSPPTKQKQRGRPRGPGKVLKLKKKMQQQHPQKRGRPYKVKMSVKTTGELQHGKRERRGRPRKIKVPADTYTNELSSQNKNQPEESEPLGKESVAEIDKQQCVGKGASKAKASQNNPTVVLLPVKGKSELDQPLDKVEHLEKAADTTNADHLQGRDMVTSSAEQALKSSEGRITRSRLAGP